MFDALLWREEINTKYKVESDLEWEELEQVVLPYVHSHSKSYVEQWIFRYCMGFFQEVGDVYHLDFTFKRRIPRQREGTQEAFFRGKLVDFKIALTGGGVPDLPMQLLLGEEVFIPDAVRPKLDGVRFVRDGDFFLGEWLIPVTETQVLEMEFVGISMYQVLPYNYVNGEVSGHNVLPHSYSNMVSPSEEGIVMLFEGKEYRLKRRPTLEIEVMNGKYGQLDVEGVPSSFSGVVEVCLNGFDLEFVRVRKGKVGVQDAVKKLSRMAFLDQWEYSSLTLPHRVEDRVVMGWDEEVYGIPLGLANKFKHAQVVKTKLQVGKTTIIVKNPGTEVTVRREVESVFSEEQCRKIGEVDEVNVERSEVTTEWVGVILKDRWKQGMFDTPDGYRNKVLRGKSIQCVQKELAALRIQGDPEFFSFYDRYREGDDVVVYYTYHGDLSGVECYWIDDRLKVPDSIFSKWFVEVTEPKISVVKTGGTKFTQTELMHTSHFQIVKRKVPLSNNWIASPRDRNL